MKPRSIKVPRPAPGGEADQLGPGVSRVGDPLHGRRHDAVKTALAELDRRAAAWATKEELDPALLEFHRVLELRYLGQSSELSVPLDDDVNTLAAVIAAGSVSISAQAPAPAKAPAKPATTYAPPKTPWGDPDISGNYTNKYEQGTPFERPQEFEGMQTQESE